MPASSARPQRTLRVARTPWTVARTPIPAPQPGVGHELESTPCQNPECRRVGLRCHAHHIEPRAEGGGDDEANGVTLCQGCQVRLVHARTGEGVPRLGVRARVVGGLDALLWTWADKRRVLQLREWPHPC